MKDNKCSASSIFHGKWIRCQLKEKHRGKHNHLVTWVNEKQVGDTE